MARFDNQRTGAKVENFCETLPCFGENIVMPFSHPFLKEMASPSQGDAKFYPRCRHTLAILMSKPRSSLEASKKQPRVWQQYDWQFQKEKDIIAIK